MEQSVKEILADDFWIMPATPEYIDEGVPYITSKNIKNGIIDFTKVNYISQDAYESISKNRPILVGDILISMIGTLGETAEVKETDGSFYGQNMFLVRLDESKVNKRYFLYFFKSNSVKRALEGKQNQSTQKYLKANHIENLTIPMPSLDEQKLVAEQLDKLSQIIALRSEELKHLDELIKARFVELFGIPIDNTKNWPMDKAVNLCTLVTDGSHFSPKACDEGYPMLSVKDMRQNGFDYSDCKLVDDETFEILKKQGCVPQVDDVLIAKDGSYFTRAFAITEYKEQAILSSIGMYRPDIDRILPRFLASYLMTNEVIEFVNRGYVTGTALRRVIIKGLKNIPVYMPPLELQKEFVQFAEQVDKSKVVA